MEKKMKIDEYGNEYGLVKIGTTFKQNDCFFLNGERYDIDYTWKAEDSNVEVLETSGGFVIMRNIFGSTFSVWVCTDCYSPREARMYSTLYKEMANVYINPDLLHLC